MKTIVFLDRIRSLYNVGAFFRTADGSGVVEKIILSGYTPVPPRREISKTALGAEQIIPFESPDDPIQYLKNLKKRGYTLVAIEQTAHSVDYTQYHYAERCCLIFGNEIEGVGSDILKIVDACVEIPMRGQKKSLNVAVAGGVILYAVAQQG